MIIPRRFLNRFSRTPKPPTAASPPPKAVFLSLSFHVLFRFSAAAQASLHRPAPRTRSRATLIPLLRPLDRRKGQKTPIDNTTKDASRLTRRLAYRGKCRRAIDRAHRVPVESRSQNRVGGRATYYNRHLCAPSSILPCQPRWNRTPHLHQTQ